MPAFVDHAIVAACADARPLAVIVKGVIVFGLGCILLVVIIRRIVLPIIDREGLYDVIRNAKFVGSFFGAAILFTIAFAPAAYLVGAFAPTINHVITTACADAVAGAEWRDAVRATTP